MAAITTILKLYHAITCIIPVYVDGGAPADSYLLMETGDFLLLETGDYIILD